MSALCMYVDSSCPYGQNLIHTTNNSCLKTQNFMMTGVADYGATYNGIVQSVKSGYSGVGDYINLYLDNNCATLAEQVVLTSGCNNSAIFLNGSKFSSYKIC